MQVTAAIRNLRVSQLQRVAPLMHAQSEYRKENLFSGCCVFTYFGPIFGPFSFQNGKQLFYRLF